MNPIHISNPISLRFILILSSIYNKVFHTISSLQAFQPKFCMHLSPLEIIRQWNPVAIRNVEPYIESTIVKGAFPTYLITLCNSLHPLVTSSLLGPNILHSTLLSYTLSLCYSLKTRDQVSHPHKTTGKIKVLNILRITFLDSRQKNKRF
jgi:hypothetical protein